MTPEQRYEKLRERIQPSRDALLNHRVYQHINNIPALRMFTEFHVWAVWDFMSLLKTVQRSVCRVEAPWWPSAQSPLIRLVHEIVLAEETDVTPDGGYASHFELYRGAMREFGASTDPIDRMIGQLRAGQSITSAIDSIDLPMAIRDFVSHTFTIIGRGSLPAVVSAFTFGREDLLPDVFSRVVEGLPSESSQSVEAFRYYLRRHVELDGDEHGPMAARLVMAVCDEDDAAWREASSAAETSLQVRHALWDGMLDAILHSNRMNRRNTGS